MEVYNLTQHVVAKLRLSDAVFTTAMCYWHEFVARHGLGEVHRIVLAAACIFLAGKVEHYRMRADAVLTYALDLKKEDVETWHDNLLEVELVLCDALHFDFQRTHAIGNVLALLSKPYNKPLQKQSEEERAVGKAMGVAVQRMYLFSLITPLYTKASADAILRTIVYAAVSLSYHEKMYEHVIQREYPPPPEKERDGIFSVLVDAFAYMHKQSGVKAFDALIESRRKRSRSSNGSRVFSSSVLSSALSGESAEPSPTIKRNLPQF
ncbi:cyclin 9 [Strigomonas culicis]|nr:cyclin 9 [Strigomonas culicis]|eukprot:EPY26577.1 cyclin 9 [Strigomonas culicis]